MALLPFWDPLIPPMGVSCLKSFLLLHGYRVKAVDANTHGMFKEIQDRYFNQLKAALPEDKWGNFFNIGKEVLRSHMMAHLHQRDQSEYIELVRLLIRWNFFCEAGTNHIRELNRTVEEFYLGLEDYILELLKAEKPAVFGLSVFQGTLAASMFAFRLAKEYDSHIQTVMGGGIFADHLVPGSPNLDVFLQKTPYIDKMIVGEGEQLLFEYLEGKLPASQRVYTLADIGDNVLDVSAAPTADFSDLDLRYYPQAAAYTSRGCPFRCNFCSETVRWGHYRRKKGHRVVADLNELYRRHHSQLFLMCDSLLNPITTELAQAILSNEIPFYWDGYLRVDSRLNDASLVLSWRQGGFYRVRLGIESGSQRVLDLMEKKIKVEEIKSSLFHLADAGIKTTTYWVMGYPGETEGDFQQTLDLVEEMASYIYEADCNPFTYFFSGQVNSDNWSELRYPLYPGSIQDLLIMQTWDLDTSPSRQEKYERVRKFIAHCRSLGIPNPYSLYDINRADNRWKQLHKNAVPGLADFRNTRSLVKESRDVKKRNIAAQSVSEINFNF